MFSLKKNLTNPHLVQSIGSQLIRTLATAPATSKSYKFDNARYGKNIVLIEGVRTPFTMSSTDYDGLYPHELQRMALW